MLIELAIGLLHAFLRPYHMTPSPDAVVIAQAAVHAVEQDAEEPLTGSRRGDVALLMEFARGESSFRLTGKDGRCLEGDHGAALGAFQLQHTQRDLACAPETAARIWLTMARASVKRCAHLEPDFRLAALASGNCQHGRLVSRMRMMAARAALATLDEEASR